MVRIVADIACGNSPKMQTLKDLNVVFAQGDMDAAVAPFVDGLHWDVVGRDTLEGIEAVRAYLERESHRERSEYVVEGILSHGRAGALHGREASADGTERAFCHFSTITSTAKDARIKQIVSYLIDL